MSKEESLAFTQLRQELTKRENYWRDWNGRAANNAAKLEARIIEVEAEAKRLWALLDDISSAGDQFKPEINGYFKAVNHNCDQRDGLFYSDGWNILLTADKK